MREALALDAVPDLPQTTFLDQLAPALWARPDVQALWLEGSLGRGNADLYSDVDLYVGVMPATHQGWRDLDVSQLFGDFYAAHHYSDFADDFIVYHVYLTAGVIYDLHIQPRGRELPAAHRLILACRDDAYHSELLAAIPDTADENQARFGPKPLDPADIPGLIIGYWINADKSRKVLYRDQDFIGYTGLHLFRQMLARLLYIEQTGRDCGDLTRIGIHGLKAAAAVLGEALGEELGLLMGAPTRTRQEMWAVQARLNQEVARVGALLAERYGVAYPAALAAVVMENWVHFEQEIVKN